MNVSPTPRPPTATFRRSWANAPWVASAASASVATNLPDMALLRVGAVAVGDCDGCELSLSLGKHYQRQTAAQSLHVGGIMGRIRARPRAQCRAPSGSPPPARRRRGAPG